MKWPKAIADNFVYVGTYILQFRNERSINSSNQINPATNLNKISVQMAYGTGEKHGVTHAIASWYPRITPNSGETGVLHNDKDQRHSKHETAGAAWWKLYRSSSVFDLYSLRHWGKLYLIVS